MPKKRGCGPDEDGGHDQNQTVQRDHSRQCGSSVLRKAAGEREEDRGVADGVDDRKQSTDYHKSVSGQVSECAVHDRQSTGWDSRFSVANTYRARAPLLRCASRTGQNLGIRSRSSFRRLSRSSRGAPPTAPGATKPAAIMLTRMGAFFPLSTSQSSSSFES